MKVLLSYLDAEFDSLADKFGYNGVGYTVTDGIPHLYKMYSLQKVFSEADLPSDIDNYFCTPKLDGAAVSILYVNGTTSSWSSHEATVTLDET